MSQPVLQIEGLTKRFGGLIAVDNLSLALAPRRLHAIIGPNGAGKTTLFNLVCGFLSADAGRVFSAGRDIGGLKPHQISRLGIARTLQIKSVFNRLSVEENIWIAAHARNRFLHPLRSAEKDRGTREKVERVLEEVGLSALAQREAGALSYGDVALLEIGIALAQEPRLLLLDEPICGMSPAETGRTVAKIRQLAARVDIVIIEHDMEVVFEIADDITVMAQGAVLASGAPDVIARDERVREAYLGQPDDEDFTEPAHA
jgi:branched-chain amino acid transport system ATP-binding protein